MLRCDCADCAWMSDVELIKRVTESIKSIPIMLQEWVRFAFSIRLKFDLVVAKPMKSNEKSVKLSQSPPRFVDLSIDA